MGTKAKREREAEGYPSEIHKLLGLSPREIEEELGARGASADGVARAFGKLATALARELPAGPAAPLELRLHAAGSLEFAPADHEAAAIFRRLDGGAAFAESARGSERWAKAKVVPCADIDPVPSKAPDQLFDLVVFDPESEPADGDVVLAWLPATGRTLHRFRQIGTEEVCLEGLAGRLGEREVGHPGNFVIYGVALALARRAS